MNTVLRVGALLLFALAVFGSAWVRRDTSTIPLSIVVFSSAG